MNQAHPRPLGGIDRSEASARESVQPASAMIDVQAVDTLHEVTIEGEPRIRVRRRESEDGSRGAERRPRLAGDGRARAVELRAAAMGRNRTLLLIAPAVLVIGVFMLIPMFIALVLFLPDRQSLWRRAAAADLRCLCPVPVPARLRRQPGLFAELHLHHPALGLSRGRDHRHLPRARPAGRLVHRLPDARSAGASCSSSSPCPSGSTR